MVFVGKLDDVFQNSNLTGTAGLVILRKALRPPLRGVKLLTDPREMEAEFIRGFPGAALVWP